MAFRAIIQEKKESFKTSSSFDEKFGCGILDLSLNESPSFGSYANLVSHNQSSNKKAPELMMQACVAVFFLRALYNQGYFGPKSTFNPQKMSDQDLLFVNLLHRFMRISFYNTHEICGTRKNTFNGETIRIGRATFSNLALFNHSCDPNYRRINVGQFIVAVAIRDIEVSSYMGMSQAFREEIRKFWS